MSEKISQSDLEAFDAGSRTHGVERRFLCPLCHGDRPRDAAHRSLCANTQKGVWHCYRCGANGLLAERSPEAGARPMLPRTQAARAKARTRFLPTPPIEPTTAKDSEPPRYDFEAQWADTVDVTNTPGEEYLRSRGISTSVAMGFGVRYADNCIGEQAVIFPLRHPKSGDLVAFVARSISPASTWKRTLKATPGVAHGGVFITPGALEGKAPVVLTEAPIDALTLAMCGIPAIAVAGTSCPDELIDKLAFRKVIIAFDADDAGEKGAAKLATELHAVGAVPSRLRPPGGTKDWNEALQKFGQHALYVMLRAALDLPSTPTRDPQAATPERFEALYVRAKRLARLSSDKEERRAAARLAEFAAAYDLALSLGAEAAAAWRLQNLKACHAVLDRLEGTTTRSQLPTPATILELFPSPNPVVDPRNGTACSRLNLEAKAEACAFAHSYWPGLVPGAEEAQCTLFMHMYSSGRGSKDYAETESRLVGQIERAAAAEIARRCP